MLAVLPATAQDAEPESDPAPGPDTAWSVYVQSDPTQCWVVSSPVSMVNTRNGEVVEVSRGETLFFVSYWPDRNRIGEVSFTGGYPFETGSTVALEVGGETFDLFTEGEMSWSDSAEEDEAIISALRRGSEAVLTARSTRGTQTADTFSLQGFAAAVDDAEARCGASGG
ncbi:hypothetical protein HKCCE2091_02130 [Rhodobacterales bacterium HKCCE2091]|nr:hypothetical protein [Rhodobacterales bacterium HKCCE2091]